MWLVCWRPAVSDLLHKIRNIHRALSKADIPHAFGGALALAWCTEQARATIDVDVNVFLKADDAPRVVRSLPKAVVWTEADVIVLQRDMQVRLWWENTPVDLFLNSTEWHERLLDRIRWERLGNLKMPFLCCEDLAIFKALFNRTKDWADLEAMRDAGTLNIKNVMAAIIEFLGADDVRVDKLEALQ